MPLEEDLKKQLVDAMKAKDQKTADAIRMIKTKIMEKRTSAGFAASGAVVDDALIVDVIATYRKSLVKAQGEFLAAGERGKAQADELGWEIAFLEKYLPKKLGGDELRAIVMAAIAAANVTDPKQAGRVVGEVMKQHKGLVEAADVKKLVEEELAAK
jgi:uncharacterized protein YqeY